MNLVDIGKWDGRVSRLAYLLAGLIGFAIKHNLDRFLAYEFGLPWHIWSYWEPLQGAIHPHSLAGPDRDFLAMLLLTTLPFIWIGVAMTMKRLRDAAQPLWLTVLFFAPVVNLLFFAVLCALPSREPRTKSTALVTPIPVSVGFGAQSRVGSAALAAAVAGARGTSITWIDLRS